MFGIGCILWDILGSWAFGICIAEGISIVFGCKMMASIMIKTIHEAMIRILSHLWHSLQVSSRFDFKLMPANQVWTSLFSDPQRQSISYIQFHASHFVTPLNFESIPSVH